MTNIPTRQVSINQAEYLETKLKDVEDHKHILLDFGDQEDIRKIITDWKRLKRMEAATLKVLTERKDNQHEERS